MTPALLSEKIQRYSQTFVLYMIELEISAEISYLKLMFFLKIWFTKILKDDFKVKIFYENMLSHTKKLFFKINFWLRKLLETFDLTDIYFIHVKAVFVFNHGYNVMLELS